MSEILFSEIPLENLLSVVFAVALIVALVVRLIKDVFNIRTLDDDDFQKEKDDDEKVEALRRTSVWCCDACDVEFRLSSDIIPSVCPSCGKQLVPIPNRWLGDEAVPYICSRCGSYVMLGGDNSGLCPICGSNDVEEAAWVAQDFGFWACTGCDQEFTIPDGLSPQKCPHCGESFADCSGEVDDDSSKYTCPHCGEKVEMLDGVEMEHCPKCGEEMGDDDDEP